MDELLECLEWWWFANEANEAVGYFCYDDDIQIELSDESKDELFAIENHAWEKFFELQNELRIKYTNNPG